MRERPKHGARWGRWRFNAHVLSLEILGAGKRSHIIEYDVDLERCKTSAATLDWLCQVMHKRWTTNKDVGDLLQAIDELADGLQSVMCGGGVEMMEGQNWARELLEKTP